MGQHITEVRAKTSNLIFSYVFSLIFYKKIYHLDPCLLFVLFWKSHKPTELVQILTHIAQKTFPQVD